MQDRTYLDKLCGVDAKLANGQYIKRPALYKKYALTNLNCDDADYPTCGGANCLSEGHDEVYKTLSLLSLGEENFDNIITAGAVRGLHRCPEVPCTRDSESGLVCVNLEASRFFLESYFGLGCHLADGGDAPVLPGVAPFYFVANPRADWKSETLNILMASADSIAAFRHYASPRGRLFAAASLGDKAMLPAFGPIQPALVAPLAGAAGSSSQLSTSSSSSSSLSPPGGVPTSSSASASDSRKRSREDIVSCRVCDTVMREPVTLMCGHSNCLKCLKRTFAQGHRRCPLCNEKQDAAIESKLRVNITLRDTIEELCPTPKRGKASTKGVFTSSLLALSYPDNDADTPVHASAQEAAAALIRLTELRELAVRDPQKFPRKRNKEMRSAAEECALAADDFLLAFEAETCIHDGALQNVLRRAGVLLEEAAVYDALRGFASEYLESVLGYVVLHTEYRGSKVVMVEDVLKTKGVTMLGYGGPCGVRYTWNESIQNVLKQTNPRLEVVSAQVMSVFNDFASLILHKLLTKALDFMSQERAREGPIDEDDDDDDLDDHDLDDPRATGFRDFNAGAWSDDPGAFSQAQTARLFCCHMESDSWPVEFTELEKPVPCIRAKSILYAARSVFNGEFGKRALSKGCTARARFYRCDSDQKAANKSMGQKSWLIFHPEHVALVANRMTTSPITVHAAVFLAAVVEYMIAELIKLAGNAALNDLDNSSSTITCRHIMLAIRSDEELDKHFGAIAIRNGGQYSSTSFRKISDVNCLLEGLSPFDKLLCGKARKDTSTLDAYFVDPRTGSHMCASVKDGGDREDEDHWTLTPAPLLDALCKESQAERRALAQAALTDTERGTMKTEGYCILDSAEEAGANVPAGSLTSIHARRVREIHHMQKTSDSLLPLAPFARLVWQSQPGTRFTAEALDCLRAHTEHHMLLLCDQAGQEAARRKCIAVGVKDLQEARHRVEAR